MALKGRLGYYKVENIDYDEKYNLLHFDLVYKMNKHSKDKRVVQEVYEIKPKDIDTSNLAKFVYELLKRNSNGYFEDFEYEEGDE